MQWIGAPVAGALIWLGKRWWESSRSAPVTLYNQNIVWAQDMMDRMQKQIDSLEARLQGAERQWQECERRHAKLEATVALQARTISRLQGEIE